MRPSTTGLRSSCPCAIFISAPAGGENIIEREIQIGKDRQVRCSSGTGMLAWSGVSMAPVHELKELIEARVRQGRPLSISWVIQLSDIHVHAPSDSSRVPRNLAPRKQSSRCPGSRDTVRSRTKSRSDRSSSRPMRAARQPSPSTFCRFAAPAAGRCGCLTKDPRTGSAALCAPWCAAPVHSDQAVA